MRPQRADESAGRTLRIAIAGGVLLCLWGALEHYSGEKTRWGSETDAYMVGAQAERLAGVISAVPPGAVVGYITDLKPGSVAASTAFNTASYVLAPRLLVQATDKEWVLGNFSASQDYVAAGARYGVEVVKDFGNGAVLFRRRR